MSEHSDDSGMVSAYGQLLGLLVESPTSTRSSRRWTSDRRGEVATAAGYRLADVTLLEIRAHTAASSG